MKWKEKLPSKTMPKTLVLILAVVVASVSISTLSSCSETESEALPFFVTVYYHVEPNRQLYESVEPGYFECISSCIRQMSGDLADIDVSATFCFAWLYNDLVYCRNQGPGGSIVNSDGDSGIETYRQLIEDEHEIAYHTHPPLEVIEVADGDTVRYPGQPNYIRTDRASDCEFSESLFKHHWDGASADYHMDYYPGVYGFDDPEDPWFGQFTWQRTSQSLFMIADHLGATVRHANGGQRPLLDIFNEYGEGINHEHGLAQLRSMMSSGFDLISPEIMVYYSESYSADGPLWLDPSTSYVSYFGPDENIQIYYPNIDDGHIENAASTSQGLTFMPVQVPGQAAWATIGIRSPDYYDAELLGGKGGGGVDWTSETFYESYLLRADHNPWLEEERELEIPSLADQFNSAIGRHQNETPDSVNCWGINHHIVNVMWADLTGLSDNWEMEIEFLKDIADGTADGIIKEPRPDLVQFVTMQELSDIYDDASS